MENSRVKNQSSLQRLAWPMLMVMGSAVGRFRPEVTVEFDQAANFSTKLTIVPVAGI